jgi:hypothetical protein
MKHCNTCNTDKEESEFHIRKASKDGLAAKCKLCAKKYDDARANLPHRVEARTRYAKTESGIKAGNAAKLRHSKKNPIKKKASEMVSNAVRDKKIIKSSSCENCGKTNCRLNGHHDDYNFPLNVRWLCSQCHSDWHKENGPGKNGDNFQENKQQNEYKEAA